MFTYSILKSAVQSFVIYSVMALCLFGFVHSAVVKATERDCAKIEHAEQCGDGNLLSAAGRLNNALSQK